MNLLSQLNHFRVRGVLFAFALASFLGAETALAMTDKRAVAGAQSVAPAIPEPGAIVLFAAGAALVGWTVRRRRSAAE
ncbi:MAG: PEP-CTERM sorting domain-containing protein [Myxococcota bacterium]